MSQPPSKRMPWLEIRRNHNAMDESEASSGSAPKQIPAASPEMLAQTQLQVASYIEEISLELGVMARTARLDSLAYFIDMTRLEAEIARRSCEAQKPAPKRKRQ